MEANLLQKYQTRIAEIYSYFVDERYENDLSQTFSQWLAESIYGEEISQIAEDIYGSQ